MYKRTEQSDNRREETGKWVKEYAKENLGGDWDYCVSLSYRYPTLNPVASERNMRDLYKKMKKVDDDFEGFVSNEFGNKLNSLHHHLIVKSKLNEDMFKRNISNMWKRGESWTDKYDRNKGDYPSYMCKHLGKTESNTLTILSTFDI